MLRLAVPEVKRMMWRHGSGASSASPQRGSEPSHRDLRISGCSPAAAMQRRRRAADPPLRRWAGHHLTRAGRMGRIIPCRRDRSSDPAGHGSRPEVLRTVMAITAFGNPAASRGARIRLRVG